MAAELAQRFKQAAEMRLSKSFSKWTVVQCRSQVVAGFNYYVKVDAGSEYVHLRIYKHFNDPAKDELTAVQGGLALATPLE